MNDEGQRFTPEQIRRMSPAEYEEHREEILKGLEKQPNLENLAEGSEWLRDFRQRVATMSPEEYERQRDALLLELNEQRYGRPATGQEPEPEESE